MASDATAFRVEEVVNDAPATDDTALRRVPTVNFELTAPDNEAN